ncbi:DNA replication complex GINS family protein [Candidatus Woesearchaeota archaeon]|nr:DNA replication complex GINS family protein [Candidatus Woesearchaeota archaeon]
MAVQQLNLTYETIFDVVMREKGREELQKIDESFFRDVASYIQEKNALRSLDDDKILKQVQNIRRMLRELYERREKKILNMALAASRSSPSFIDSASMMSVEKKLFEGLLGQLDYYRKSVLNTALSLKEPSVGPSAESVQKSSDSVKPVLGEFEDAGFKPASEFGLKEIRFIQFVSSFVGKELEVYGPFEAGQTAELPAELADVLISRGNAVELKE